jgi:hypothetical protein
MMRITLNAFQYFPSSRAVHLSSSLHLCSSEKHVGSALYDVRNNLSFLKIVLKPFIDTTTRALSSVGLELYSFNLSSHLRLKLFVTKLNTSSMEA